VRWLKNVPATPMTVACLAIASAVYLLPAFTTRPHLGPSIPVIAAIVSLGVICTALDARTAGCRAGCTQDLTQRGRTRVCLTG
jgi:hypothetical protein